MPKIVPAHQENHYQIPHFKYFIQIFLFPTVFNGYFSLVFLSQLSSNLDKDTSLDGENILHFDGSEEVFLT